MIAHLLHIVLFHQFSTTVDSYLRMQYLQSFKIVSILTFYGIAKSLYLKIK